MSMHSCDLAEPFLQDLAGFSSVTSLPSAFLVLAERVADAAHVLAALRRRQLAPAQERRVRRLLRAQPRLIEVAETPQTLEEHLTACKSLFTETRLFIALLSCLTIPLSFLLARRFTSPPWALFASALVSASLLTHTFAQQGAPARSRGAVHVARGRRGLAAASESELGQLRARGTRGCARAGRAAQRRGGRARGTCGALPARRPRAARVTT
jgi:hypothetical protein